MSTFSDSVSGNPEVTLMPNASQPGGGDEVPGTHPDRARAARLRAEASALADLPLPDEGHDGSGVLMALDECVSALLEQEIREIDAALKRDRVISTCMDDLTSPAEGARASGTAAALLGLADRLDGLEDRKRRGQPFAGLVRRLSAPLVALALSGAALVMGARLLPAPHWAFPGALVLGVSGALLGFGYVVAGRLDRGLALSRARVDERAQEVLARARVVNTEPSLDGDALRGYAAQVARRDLLSNLKARLEPLLIDKAARASLRERRALLTEGMSSARRDELVASRDRMPTMAMPGIAAALEQAFGKAADAAFVRGKAKGVRDGLGGALDREAAYLEDRADRADRERAAADVLQRMAPAAEASDEVDLIASGSGASSEQGPAATPVWPSAGALRKAAREAEATAASMQRAIQSASL